VPQRHLGSPSHLGAPHALQRHLRPSPRAAASPEGPPHAQQRHLRVPHVRCLTVLVSRRCPIRICWLHKRAEAASGGSVHRSELEPPRCAGAGLPARRPWRRPQQAPVRCNKHSPSGALASTRTPASCGVHAELLLPPSNPLESQSERDAQLCMSRARARLAAAPAARRRMEREGYAEVEVGLRVADDVVIMLHLLSARGRNSPCADGLAAVAAERVPLQHLSQSACPCSARRRAHAAAGISLLHAARGRLAWRRACLQEPVQPAEQPASARAARRARGACLYIT